MPRPYQQPHPPIRIAGASEDTFPMLGALGYQLFVAVRSGSLSALAPDLVAYRDAYRAAREIPVTLAQLPCYCHCDQGFGHKSLYSCFEDDHASHCDVCVREAVLALRLEKEQKMTPAQIRDTIVAQYSH